MKVDTLFSITVLDSTKPLDYRLASSSTEQYSCCFHHFCLLSKEKAVMMSTQEGHVIETSQETATPVQLEQAVWCGPGSSEKQVNKEANKVGSRLLCPMPCAPRITLVGRKVPTRPHIWAELEPGHQLYTTAVHISPKAGQWSSPSLVSLPEAEHSKALPSKGSFLTILLFSPVLRNNQKQ